MKLIEIKDKSKNTKICPKCEEENDKKMLNVNFVAMSFHKEKQDLEHVKKKIVNIQIQYI